MTPEAVRAIVEAAIASITIQGGNGISVSGGGKNITIALQQPIGPQQSAQSAEELPPGDEGDVLYHDGSTWVVLENPGAPVAEDWAFRHDGTIPYWEEPGC